MANRRGQSLSFCEPRDGLKPATWHWFALKGEEPRPLFAFPGIWRRWHGPVKKGGPNVDTEVYSIMTNHERMPVLLTKESELETWLSGSPAEAFGLVTSFDPDRMRIVQEGFDKEVLLAA